MDRPWDQQNKHRQKYKLVGHSIWNKYDWPFHCVKLTSSAPWAGTTCMCFATYCCNVFAEKISIVRNQSDFTGPIQIPPRRWIGCQTLWWPRPKSIHFSWLGPELSSVDRVHRSSTDVLLLLQISIGVVWWPLDFRLSCNMLYPLSPRLCFFIVFNFDLFVNSDDSLKSLRIIMRTEKPTKFLYHVSNWGWGRRREISLSPHPPVIHYWPV